MAEQPVSVIIPTYNRANRIINSIQSVINQSYSELEVIVVDDGSTDNTSEIVSSIADSRLRYHYLEENKGAANARNVGVSLASHDIIAFNDSDDIWHSDKLEKQIDYWNGNPECVLVYCAYKVDLPQGGILQVPATNEEMDTLRGDIFYYLLFRPVIGTPTMMVRKKFFQELGGFDTSYDVMEDWDFSIRASRLGKIGYVDQPLITVEATAQDRMSNDSSMETKMAHYETKCRILAKYIDEINKIGQFDLYAGEILKKAEKDGVVGQVKDMMMEFLRRA